MAAQMSRMSQLAIDVENLKMRNALLESELLRTRQVQTRLHERSAPPCRAICIDEGPIDAVK